MYINRDGTIRGYEGLGSIWSTIGHIASGAVNAATSFIPGGSAVRSAASTIVGAVTGGGGGETSEPVTAAPITSADVNALRQSFATKRALTQPQQAMVMSSGAGGGNVMMLAALGLLGYIVLSGGARRHRR